MTYKPAGHTSVAPYLIVSGAAQTIDFLIAVFGATEVSRHADPAGGATSWIATKVE